MWGLVFVLGFTTALLCYAGYIFLIVDKRQESAMLADTDIFEALDDKNYDFELPEEIDEYAPRHPPIDLAVSIDQSRNGRVGRTPVRCRLAAAAPFAEEELPIRTASWCRRFPIAGS